MTTDKSSPSNVNIGQDAKGIIGKHITHASYVENIFTDSESLASIDWEKVSFRHYLSRFHSLFVKHLCRINENFSEEGIELYIPLDLQGNEFASSQKGVTNTNTKTGTWEEFIKLPGNYLISGDSGSGKTTLLLNIAQELAAKALENQTAPIPIYIQLNRFQGGDGSKLLAMAANVSGQEVRVLRALWSENRQPLCILLDGADEIPSLHVQNFIDKLKELSILLGAERHILILTSRPGLFQSQFRESVTTFQDLIIPPLSNEQVNVFLQRYSATALSDILNLNNRVTGIVRNPGLLTSIAISIESIQQHRLPTNSGQIYKLLIDYYLAKCGDQQYDYWRVKRPVLVDLAFKIFSQDQNELVIDDSLCDQIAQQLELIYRRYDRNRVVMPNDWSTQGLLKELSGGEIITIEDSLENRLRFRERIYLEYFTAVYFEGLSADSSDIEHIKRDINAEKWFNPLIFLSGLKGNNSMISDNFFSELQPQEAVDIWLEKRPYGIDAPSCIASELKSQITALDSLKLTNYAEPLTERLMVRLLNSNNPVVRLQAVCALSQWGLSSIDMLLDASEDSNSVIKSVAQYALLHLGEPLLYGKGEKPLPPLIRAEGRNFSFQCYGGCNASIGPLRLIDMPNNIQVKLALNINDLDIDLFKEISAFTLWHNSPAWLAFSWFTAQKKVDWLGFAARCDWIAKQSFNIVQKIKSHSLLSSLSSELNQRAKYYAAFSQYFANDLGLTQQENKSHNTAEGINKDIALTYFSLRNLFNPINRPRTIKFVGEDDIIVNTEMNFEALTDNTTATGVAVENLTLLRNRQTNFRELRNVKFTQNVTSVSSAQLSGMEIQNINGDAIPFPPIAFVSGEQNIGSSENSNIRGLFTKNITHETAGLSIDLSINIDRFRESSLSGIVAENLPGDSNEQEVEMPTKEKHLEHES